MQEQRRSSPSSHAPFHSNGCSVRSAVHSKPSVHSNPSVHSHFFNILLPYFAFTLWPTSFSICHSSHTRLKLQHHCRGKTGALEHARTTMSNVGNRHLQPDRICPFSLRVERSICNGATLLASSTLLTSVVSALQSP